MQEGEPGKGSGSAAQHNTSAACGSLSAAVISASSSAHFEPHFDPGQTSPRVCSHLPRCLVAPLARRVLIHRVLHLLLKVLNHLLDQLPALWRLLALEPAKGRPGWPGWVAEGGSEGRRLPTRGLAAPPTAEQSTRAQEPIAGHREPWRAGSSSGRPQKAGVAQHRLATATTHLRRTADIARGSASPWKPVPFARARWARLGAAGVVAKSVTTAVRAAAKREALAPPAFACWRRAAAAAGRPACSSLNWALSLHSRLQPSTDRLCPPHRLPSRRAQACWPWPCSPPPAAPPPTTQSWLPAVRAQQLPCGLQAAPQLPGGRCCSLCAPTKATRRRRPRQPPSGQRSSTALPSRWASQRAALLVVLDKLAEKGCSGGCKRQGNTCSAAADAGGGHTNTPAFAPHVQGSWPAGS